MLGRNRRSQLPMPRCPGMPEIVEPKICQPCFFLHVMPRGIHDVSLDRIPHPPIRISASTPSASPSEPSPNILKKLLKRTKRKGLVLLPSPFLLAAKRRRTPLPQPVPVRWSALGIHQTPTISLRVLKPFGQASLLFSLRNLFQSMFKAPNSS